MNTTQTFCKPRNVTTVHEISCNKLSFHEGDLPLDSALLSYLCDLHKLYLNETHIM